MTIREQYDAKVRERDAYVERMRDTTTTAAGPMARKALRLEREVDALREQLTRGRRVGREAAAEAGRRLPPWPHGSEPHRVS